MRHAMWGSLAIAALLFAALAQGQTTSYTITFPTAYEADLLTAFAKNYPQQQATTLEDNSVVTLTYGLTVCVPASAADAEAGVCVMRATTTAERRVILKRQLRAYMRDMYRAHVGGTAGDAARAAALAAADAAVPVEP